PTRPTNGVRWLSRPTSSRTDAVMQIKYSVTCVTRKSDARPCRRGDRMKRREFIALLGGAAAAWPLAADAQEADRVRRIGALLPLVEDDPFARVEVSAFVAALQQAGWTDGRNARIEIRWAGPTPSDIRRHAAQADKLFKESLEIADKATPENVS